MNSAHEGIVELSIGGVKTRLCFTWSVLSQLRELYGTNFEKTIVMATADFDLDKVAEIISVASGGAVTPEFVKEKSPAIVECATAIDKAMTYAFYGSGKPEISPDGIKKNGLTTLLRNLLRSRAE